MGFWGNAFYATNNAKAERLTKFVAAASAAAYCETTTLNAGTALIEFPVDPSTPTFSQEVESELLIQGLGLTGSSAINFGVPAAFFYALGASLDKNTTSVQRYQLATGDAIERLLQELTAAVNSSVIVDSEGFTSSVASSLAKVSSFQAARRLVALGVSAASTSAAVTLVPGTSLAKLISAWLITPDPAIASPSNPPLSYPNTDFNIWTQQLSTNTTGYLALDLDALTQGFVIPAAVADLTVGAGTASLLTFQGVGLGMGVGMTVSGPGIAAGTTVMSIQRVVTVVLGTDLASPGVSPTTQITFQVGTGTINVFPDDGFAAGATSVTFAASPAALAIVAGVAVSGTGIAKGTVVASPPTVSTIITVSAPPSPAVPGGTSVTFGTAGTAANTLAQQIENWLPTTASPPASLTVESLKKVTAAQWLTFFTIVGGPSWLPPFTQPVAPGASAGASANPQNQNTGYIALRIRAFVRAVQQFFTVSSVATSAQLPLPGAPPVFSVIPNDPITQAMAGLPAGFKFGTTLTTTQASAAAQGVFNADTSAQAWLTQALMAINDLCTVTAGIKPPTLTTGSLPNPVSYEFSLVESLYARGFRSAADIAGLSGADFQQALIGTVAYDAAAPIYAAAQPPVVTPPPTGEGESFQPINPNGTLVNCIPPPCLSPLGPIAYLHEMLQLLPSSTCEQPFPTPATGQMTLGAALAARRGPIGNLLASCANLETPLPLIDLVNECLEYLGAPQPAPAVTDSGTVYNTSADELAGVSLCRRGECTHEDAKECHDAAAMFDALPEYSTPATPVLANQAVQPLVYNNLKVDFSACNLPYSQALDVSRTYLRHFGSCRFEELRAFRKCITEFALDPANPPLGFQSYRLRYPVRIESAIEYLGITPEEYTLLFQGTAAQSCSAVSPVNPPPGNGNTPPGTPVGATSVPAPEATQGSVAATQEFGAALTGVSPTREQGPMNLGDFLAATCLTYCEFLELWKAVFTKADSPVAQTAVFPDCEPCCLSDYVLPLPDGYQANPVLTQLAVFIRLWRKLREVCGAGYSFTQLYDICTVLPLFVGSAVNPEFIRQLAAFQMLRDQFALPLADPSDKTPGASGADRTHLLALWVGPSAKKWRWAVGRLIEGVEHHAKSRYGCVRPRGEGTAHMVDNLDALSRLAGFNPSTPSSPSVDTWYSSPGCTLRFAEVLAKICASQFRIGEVLYLFNAAPPRDCENPFPGQEPEEALTHPLDLPEHEREHSLWRLRERLLAVEAPEGEACDWNWPRLVAEFKARFGYAPTAGQDQLLSIGQHFFPCILEESGLTVSAAQRRYQKTLTSTQPWNTPDSPFHYDSTAMQLTVRLPLRDEAVSAALSQLPQLSGTEQAAVQDLYFAPRADLAFLAWLFPDWQSAERHLIEEPQEHRRWEYFRRHVALARARGNAIAEHLARHVVERTGCAHEEVAEVADLVLSHLWADENTGTPWESASGAPPKVMWYPPPCGGALAALLGLVGTGLLGEYSGATAAAVSAAQAAAGSGSATPILWRDVRGPFEAFGHERDSTNSPVPTVLPPLALTSTSNPLAPVNNGYGVRSSDGLRLGGAESFSVSWSGVLLIETEGDYAFHAGAPTPEGERPDAERADGSSWRVTLKRGQRSWTVLNHQWPGDTSQDRNMPRLRPGAYQIVIDYSQPAPVWSGSTLRPQRTGFEVKYAGPDSAHCLITLPLSRLYRDFKDQTLDQGVQFLAGTKNAQTFLAAYYTSTLRDIRRTYQRAFKAVMFCARFRLSARPCGKERSSELGYMLANPTRFAGASYYRTGSTFTLHLVDFDFNFLPLQDDYHAPIPVPPDRSTPSLQQTQAMFDWWERMFDYDCVRKEVHRSCAGPLWQLFSEANYDPPTNATALLRHIGAEPAWWDLDVRFYQDQSAPIYTVTTTDLQDERWLVRVWHADRWVRNLRQRFHAKDLSLARPDLWAALDPSAPVPNPGGSLTGNANLLAFLTESCVDTGVPRRYRDLKRLNDGLRERGRSALVSYLCANSRVLLPWMSTPTYATSAQDLSDLLLMDVQTGVCEKASRIDEAITAVQSFVRRVRLGLEGDWKIGREFARLWDSRFDTFRAWERCKRRELYPENWIEWSEFGKARRIEAFRFLESRLSTQTLSLAAPGGMDWWTDEEGALDEEPTLLQKRIPSELQPLIPPPQSVTREGLATLGSPEYAAEPTWITAVPQASTASGGTSGSTSGAGAALAQAAAVGSAQPQVLPLWMESAMKLGTRFLRVAAAGVPEAALAFVAHSSGKHTACCRECGCEHPVLVDEYYFWLTDTQFYTYTDQTDAQGNPDVSFTGSYQTGFVDSYYDAYQQQSAEWNDEDMVPPLLAKWQPTPAVRLNWCRVHNGEFGQPRCSSEYVAVAEVADLTFLGRGGDSLYFEISNPALPLPPGYSADPSPPGFRYDLPCDEAVALPEVATPPAPVSVYPGGLSSYPFFAYDDPGARLFPSAWFSPAMLVAQALRTHCRFELALNWYKRAFDPLRRDCAWMHCGESTPSGATIVAPTPSQDDIAKRAYLIWEQHGRPAAEQSEDWTQAQTELQTQAQTQVSTQTAVTGGSTDREPGGACCDSAVADDERARNRAVTLAVCQTLCDWGDALMRRRRSPEAMQQARLLFDTAAKITGRHPRSVQMAEPKTAVPVTSFVPAYAPLNPHLLDVYDLIADRRELIHRCFDARRLRSGRLDRDVCYFGDSPWREGWREVPDPCEDGWCMRPNPYRFTYQIQRALERAGRLREIDTALQTAYEKLDASVLESMRAVQEREVLALELSIRQDQWRDADWQVQALQQTKEVNQTNLLYYTNLYQNGLINDEIQNLNLATNAVQTRTCSNLTSALGEVMVLIPDSYVGAMSTFEHIPLGTKLAGLFQSIAKVIQTVADIQSETAAIDATEANWARRSAEWFNHMQTLPSEIQQTELLILGAHRRRSQNLGELNNQMRKIEHATEVQDFLRDKFTSTNLFLFLKNETARLQQDMYRLARHSALEAQRAFNFEMGHTTQSFLPEECQDSLRDSLMAGERLEMALHRMAKAYENQNIREYELMKHFSLRLQFPQEFARLKETGSCEIELREYLYDQDYPGHYMRRIKSLSVTIPCVTGPYTGVHSRVTLLSSRTRIDPRVDAPPTQCCCDCQTEGGYEACAHDVRIVHIYGAREAIVTSSGQNDSGLFELNLHDERHLPGEFHGAVARLRIELPREENYWRRETLTDFILHVQHTAREGGEPLRRAASAAARRLLPGAGWCLFDARHDFPDAWQMLRNSLRGRDARGELSVHFERKSFPYVPDGKEISITQIAVLFAADEPGCNPSEVSDCVCPEDRRPGARMVEVLHGPGGWEHATRVACLASEEWPGLYYGVCDTDIQRIGCIGERHGVKLRFPEQCGDLDRVFLLCRYERCEETPKRGNLPLPGLDSIRGATATVPR